jgi:hypothetical protein
MNISELTADHQLGDALGLLKSYRRRLLLAEVSDTDGAVPLSKLARTLAAAEYDKTPGSVTDEERRRSEIRLHHADIPPLATAGLVSYDTKRGVVRSDDLPLDGDEWLEMPVVQALKAWND